ncbi:peptide-methionine (S)-S-oxide reductase MsrA [Rosettibacter firmus]|uniref:peptide-methionine (S)-S-oxide reductase MsrA n=1 Tax=Rosettibacter firmus TaxID=3111522 RepID=UPI00336BDC33
MCFKIILLLMLLIGDYQEGKKSKVENIDKKFESIILGGGCFWCTEAIFQRVKGITSVVSGYSGGNVANPTYELVCTGKTGHAEVVKITYDPKVITLEEILEIFFSTHDPTTLNQQGADIGTQYRSVIFYYNENQKRIAEDIIKKLESEKIWDKPIVTELMEFKNFYKAEDYHQNYYNNNTHQPYCSFVISPKLNKLKKFFKEKLK